jgi:hypothetical protein
MDLGVGFFERFDRPGRTEDQGAPRREFDFFTCRGISAAAGASLNHFQGSKADNVNPGPVEQSVFQGREDQINSVVAVLEGDTSVLFIYRAR